MVQLQRARDAVVRPKGLDWGLLYLIVFTIIGVPLPVYVMSRAPTRLTPHMGEVIFWPFFVALVGLRVYMAVMALRPSKGPQDSGSTEAPRVPEVLNPEGSPETVVPEQGGDQGNRAAGQ